MTKSVALYVTPRLLTAFKKKSPPLILIMNQINQSHNFPFCIFKVLFRVIPHLFLVLPSGLFSSCFPIRTLHSFLFFPMRAMCPAHLVLLDLITLISGEKYKLWLSSCSSFQTPVSTSVLRLNSLLEQRKSLSLLQITQRNAPTLHRTRQKSLFTFTAIDNTGSFLVLWSTWLVARLVANFNICRS